eukprot:TRINITY_DN1709_c0_g1_i3.p1 TRINITY_DN1709_c0_g1~~TRINITY_DN1709_c0_g1_i3.p1  ORF type:complete len:292 (+),score=48.04 TRINITY_DN1709_c0_g1_i3:318-1193(+)
MILKYLSAKDTVACSMVCKLWRGLQNDDEVWVDKFRKKWPWDRVSHNYREKYVEKMQAFRKKSETQFKELARVLEMDMRYVHYLEIKDARLTGIPSQISVPPLTSLSVIYTNISIFPEVITSLENLTVLNMGNNKLKRIPPSLCQLKNLTKLLLNNNKIKSLPAEIGSLEKLIVLDVFNNRLEEIPEEIGVLSRLESLSAQNNRLKSLPSSICNCSHLEHINLSNNLLECLPEEIGELGNLKEMKLQQNRLTHLPDSVIEGLIFHLETLNLFGNPLRVVPESPNSELEIIF